MKAISLWQPWALAVGTNAKGIETRSWATKYRGPLAIHAAKRKNVGELIHYKCCYNWIGALGLRGRSLERLEDIFSFGAVIATCRLVDCRPTESFTVGEIDMPRRPSGCTRGLYDWTERQMGDFSPGRFGWVLENIVMLPEPLPWKGKQGFFEVSL